MVAGQDHHIFNHLVLDILFRGWRLSRSKAIIPALAPLVLYLQTHLLGKL
jgi:hypothetical protein